MKKTLYVSDLDGTLMTPEARISPESRSILNAVIERGALFSIATARTPATVADIVKGLHLTMPLAVMTGAALWNPDTDTYSEVCRFSPGTPRKLLDIYRRHGVPTFMFMLQNNHLEIYHQGPLQGFQLDFINDRKDSPYKTFHIPADGESQFPDNLDEAILFYSMYSDPEVKALYAETSQIQDINALYYHDFYGLDTGIAEAFPLSATKANAVRRLKQISGADRVVVFGDNLNDIPMLKSADVAVAVENALPQVKEIADIVIPPNTENSVARFIEEDFMKPH